MKETTLIALDTSTELCTVALHHAGLIRQQRLETPRTHSQKLLGIIETLCGSAGIGLDQLDGIAFGKGPGSFTGVRIAASAAQGLAYSLNLPVWPVSTLESMAWLVLQAEPATDRVCACLDARMGEVYVARYCRNGTARPECIEVPALATPEALAAAGDGEAWRWTGTGCQLELLAQRYRGHISPHGHYPQAEAILHLAMKQPLGQWLKAEDAQPEYIRDEVAWQKTPTGTRSR